MADYHNQAVYYVLHIKAFFLPQPFGKIQGRIGKTGLCFR
jgi:hypothetical protein